MRIALPVPTTRLALGLAVGLLSAALACGGSESPTSAPVASGHGGTWGLPGVPPEAPNHFEPVISENHWHKATLNVAQSMMDLPLTVGIQGGADHPHQIEVSREEMLRISNYETVSIRSSLNEGHSHWVTYH